MIDLNRDTAPELADRRCAVCNGCGWAHGKVCRCVGRRIFRACYSRWRELRRDRDLWPVLASQVRIRWEYPQCEYLADFERIARRALDPGHYRLFRLHYIDGHSWRVCDRVMKLGRGRTICHAFYRIEYRLGEAFIRARPYPLFPVSEYFSASAADRKVMVA